jgi:hypothetical protein
MISGNRNRTAKKMDVKTIFRLLVRHWWACRKKNGCNNNFYHLQRVRMPSRAGKSWVYGDYGVRGGVMCKVNIYICVFAESLSTCFSYLCVSIAALAACFLRQNWKILHSHVTAGTEEPSFPPQRDRIVNSCYLLYKCVVKYICPNPRATFHPSEWHIFQDILGITILMDHQNISPSIFHILFKNVGWFCSCPGLQRGH